MWEIYEDPLSTVPWAVAYNGQLKARFMSYSKAWDYMVNVSNKEEM